MGSELPQHRSNPGDPLPGSVACTGLVARWRPAGLPVTWAVVRGSARAADFSL